MHNCVHQEKATRSGSNCDVRIRQTTD